MTKAERERLEAVWRGRVADFEASGQTGAAWARAHQVTRGQLYYWRARLSRKGSASPEGRFVPVHLEDPPEEPSAPLVVQVGAVRVEVRRGCDLELLRGVVRSLAWG
jgi:transposase-like protein